MAGVKESEVKFVYNNTKEDVDKFMHEGVQVSSKRLAGTSLVKVKEDKFELNTEMKVGQGS